MREARDIKLSAPMLLLPSIQVNIRAGKFPPAESQRSALPQDPREAEGGSSDLRVGRDLIARYAAAPVVARTSNVSSDLVPLRPSRFDMVSSAPTFASASLTIARLGPLPTGLLSFPRKKALADLVEFVGRNPRPLVLDRDGVLPGGPDNTSFARVLHAGFMQVSKRELKAFSVRVEHHRPDAGINRSGRAIVPWSSSDDFLQNRSHRDGVSGASTVCESSA